MPLWPPSDDQLKERSDVVEPTDSSAVAGTLRPPHANERHAASLTPLDRVALRITSLVGSMACVAIFCCISLVALPSVIRAGSSTLWVAWLSSQFLQLVLLPLLMVGQNLLGRHSEERAQADFEVNQKAFADTEAILTRLESIDSKILTLTESKP